MPAKMPLKRAAHARALRFSTLTLCFVLVLAGIPFNARVKGQNNPNANQANQDGPRTKGAPGPNLPNLEAARATGARDEMQPDIIPLPPKAATRCRHHDTRCKETKEKRSSLRPNYDRFSNLWAYQRTPDKLFAWQGATLSPMLDIQPEAYPDALPSFVPTAIAPNQDQANAQLRIFEKMRQRMPRAAASSLLPPAMQGGN